MRALCLHSLPPFFRSPSSFTRSLVAARSLSLWEAMSGQMTGNEALALWMKQQTDSAQLAQQEQQHTQHLLDSLAAQHSHQPTATTTMYAAFPTGQPLYSTTSSASQAIPFPSHLVQHDNNSYEDSFPLVDNYSYGTPSYAGSWTGSSSYTSDSFAPPPPAPADAFLASYGHQPPQQHQQQHGFAMGDHYNPFLSYRDPAMGSAHGVDEEAGSAYGGSSVAGGASSTAGSAIGAADDLGGMIDFDFEPMVIGEGGSSSSAPPSPFAGSEGAEMQVEGGQGGRYRMGAGGTFISPSQQQRDVGTPGSDRESSAALPLVFTSTLSESPPASSADFPTAAARTTSPPLLAPLAIPSDGPSFNLIPPSAATARPRDPPKGADTLELESILGMGEWPTKQQVRTLLHLLRRDAAFAVPRGRTENQSDLRGFTP